MESSTLAYTRFLSTPSARRATYIHRPQFVQQLYFYPRPPRGGRLQRPWPRPPKQKFLSTPSARRATPCESRRAFPGSISIHALREEGDGPPGGERRGGRDFYPRPPRGGRPCDRAITIRMIEISIHALREEGDFWDRAESLRRRISIHALREEGDSGAWDAGYSFGISIHALREEGDRVPWLLLVPLSYFYPRPPRGGRHRFKLDAFTDLIFLSTPSARRATNGWTPPKPPPKQFLSTPSARRATVSASAPSMPMYYFYPRPPRGGRPVEDGSSFPNIPYFYPRPPRGGRPPAGQWTENQKHISIHALREEGDILSASMSHGVALFLSTPSARRATG